MRPVLRVSWLLAVAAVSAGCGVPAPSLLAPARLAPDVVPPPGASAAVVTARAPGRGVSGQVLDGATGAPLAGVRVLATAADGATAMADSDASGAFRLPGTSGLSALAAVGPTAGSGCYTDLDTPATVGADSSVTVLVLLAPAPCSTDLM